MSGEHPVSTENNLVQATAATDAIRTAMAAFHKTSRFIIRRAPETEPEECRPLEFRGILIALPASLLLWWLILEVVR